MCSILERSIYQTLVLVVVSPASAIYYDSLKECETYIMYDVLGTNLCN